MDNVNIPIYVFNLNFLSELLINNEVADRCRCRFDVDLAIQLFNCRFEFAIYNLEFVINHERENNNENQNEKRARSKFKIQNQIEFFYEIELKKKKKSS
jgi:hypothetical protein